MLINHGAALDAQDEGGQTALIKVAIRGHSYIADCLIRTGAKFDIKDRSVKLLSLLPLNIVRHCRAVSVA